MKIIAYILAGLFILIGALFHYRLLWSSFQSIMVFYRRDIGCDWTGISVVRYKAEDSRFWRECDTENRSSS